MHALSEMLRPAGPVEEQKAAAIVPLDVAVAAQHGAAGARKRLSDEEIQVLFAGLGAASTEVSAVEDLLSARRESYREDGRPGRRKR